MNGEMGRTAALTAQSSASATAAAAATQAYHQHMSMLQSNGGMLLESDGRSSSMPIASLGSQLPNAFSSSSSMSADHAAAAAAVMSANGFYPPLPSPTWMHPNFAMSSMNANALAKFTWRKGKWTEEEELYTKKLIDAFNSGFLKIASGTTLRSFLAERLFWYVTLPLFRLVAVVTVVFTRKYSTF